MAEAGCDLFNCTHTKIGGVRWRPRPQLICDTWPVEAKLSGAHSLTKKTEDPVQCKERGS